MKTLIEKLKNRDERGSALMFVAGSLVLLMGIAAFGVDLGWFYLNSSRVQRAADAASLAGVIHLPANEPAAIANAYAVAIQNGYDDSDADTTVVPARVSSNQLEVTVSQDVPTFFLKVFGMNTQTITETATAEYIPPLKLGSPSNKFGNDPSCYTTNTDCAGNFWANIHGTSTDTGMGDAFSSYCFNASATGCAQSPQYRDTGYLYGIIPGGNSMSIETLDLNFRNESGGVLNDDFHRTGDHNDFCGGAGCVGPDIRVNIYRPDPTPLDITDNTLHCTEVYSPLPQIDPDDGPDETPPFGTGTWAYWDSVCGGSINTSSAPTGIWVVQIVANDTDGDGLTDLADGNRDHSGLNRYSIRSNGPNLFALGDFSIYNNAEGTATQFYLAEVPDFYAGKTFVVEMYDTGESAATGLLQPIDPQTGSVFDSGECRIYSRSIGDTSWGTADTTIPAGSNCEESVASGEYNRQWLKFEMDLPPGYSCTDCWWRMNYDYPTAVNDTTTWRAFMIGNPIHLIP